MPNYDVTINLLTGTEIAETITGAADLVTVLASGILDGSGQTLEDIRADGYNNILSATSAVNYSPYIIGTIEVVEQP